MATPIGNLGDVTHRALDVLRSADVVAAEDTRITRRLLDHYGIAARLMALHEHNEQRRTQQVMDLLASGAIVALVSDAGTPAVSDPGARLVRGVLDAGHPVSPIPGANAAIAALCASGFEAPHFLFYGFLPSRHGERVRALQALAHAPYVLVFYEAPHRVIESIDDLCAVLGAEREAVLAREITKRFETIHRCRLGEAAGWLAADENRTRGEFVILVDAAPDEPPSPGLAPREVLAVLLGELPVKQAVSLAMRLTGARRNELYEMALAMKGE